MMNVIDLDKAPVEPYITETTPDYTIRVKSFVSSKSDVLTERVNEWIEKMAEEHGYIFLDSLKLKPMISYTDINNKGAYMVGCLAIYKIDSAKPF